MQYKLIPQNFELVSGNDKVLRFTTKDEDGAIVDLTGSTIIWALAASDKAKKRIIEYTSPVQVTLTDPTAGLFEVAILSADTEPLKERDYYHEARMTNALGRKITLAYGTVSLRSNVIVA